MKESRRVPLIVYTVLSLAIFGLLAAGAYYLGQQRAASDQDAPSSSSSSMESSSVLSSRPQSSSTQNASSNITSAAESSSDFNSAYPAGSDEGTRLDLTIAEKYDLEIGFGEVFLRATDQTPCVTITSGHDITLNQRMDGDTCRLSYSMRGALSGGKHVVVTFWLPLQSIRELEVEMSAGALQVDGVQADEFDLTMFAGQTTLQNCSFRSADFDLSAGELIYSAEASIQKIDAEVTAGSMQLRLPKDISSFRLDYEAFLGGFTNKSGFALTSSQSNHLLNHTGSYYYGSPPYGCRIDLEISAGSLELSDY